MVFIKNNKLWDNINSKKHQFKKGHISFIKGKTKENYEPLQKISNVMKNNKLWDNINSKKHQFKKGHIPFIKGKTKENYEPLRRISKAMKNGGAILARMANKGQTSKTEIKLINLIKQYKINLIHVGNSKKWFKGKNQNFNPDFINEEKKKIVEVFGDYWHNLPEKKKTDKERLKTYKKYGFDTLIIWEHELKNNPNQIINKIKNYMK